MPLIGTILVTIACVALSVGCAHREPTTRRHEITRKAPGRVAPTHTRARADLSWPLHGKISSGFGSKRGSHHHRGVDIRVASGTAIRAAAPGRASFVGRMSGYGNTVILDHGGGLETRYAHNRANLVRQGEWVDVGGVIAEVGSSGNASAPHLHFEVREEGRALDPLPFLAPRSLPANQ